MWKSAGFLMTKTSANKRLFNKIYVLAYLGDGRLARQQVRQSHRNASALPTT